jgi:hypothetical protein
MLVLCLVSSLAACSKAPPDRLDPGPDRGRANPARPATPATIAESEGSTPRPRAASGMVEHTVAERTVGGVILRRDEDVLRIERAELLRSEGGEEIFVRASTRGPAGYEYCSLMTGKALSALRKAIEDGDPSEAPTVAVPFWSDPLRTEVFSSGDTYAVSFREDPKRKGGGSPDPRDTPFFVLCSKDTVGGEGAYSTTWYDVAHVEGTPEAS